jgi:4-oxalocrotonate tautomerase
MENTMPEVYVHAVKGRTAEQKKGLLKDITEAVIKNFGAQPESIVVSIIETDAADKSKGGVPFSELRR